MGLVYKTFLKNLIVHLKKKKYTHIYINIYIYAHIKIARNPQNAIIERLHLRNKIKGYRFPKIHYSESTRLFNVFTHKIWQGTFNYFYDRLYIYLFLLLLPIIKSTNNKFSVLYIIPRILYPRCFCLYKFPSEN